MNEKCLITVSSALAVFSLMTDDVVGPVEMALYSGLLSLVGGFAAAMRQQKDTKTLLAYGVNTMILGASISLISYSMFHRYPQYMIAFVGVSGALSLGGLVTVDWAVGLLKTRIEKKVKKDD